MNVDVARGVLGNTDDKVSFEFKYTLLKYFAGVTQFLAWPVVFCLSFVFLDLKISGRGNLKQINSPFIVVSNHVSSYDSFIFRLILGFFTSKLPFRFMAVKKFDIFYLNFLSYIKVIDIIYVLFGVFVVEKGKGIDKNLEKAVKIIKNGGNVVVYPEGSIIKSGIIEEFKVGAAVLAQKTSVPILPISIKLGEKRFFRRKFIVNIGKPVEIVRDEIPKTAADNLRKIVVELHGRG